ncbi:ATP-binding protein [Methanococcoides orientis]|uniref:ATP-binding protein n=1 Tax=Methanococcoides orientis TaxID=2822137 RepID=UPI001E45A8BA|nr:ATP-binding protein [Methanococcoides orientis]UGV40711.1 ATP-binding protein [Methanococcoides orientis]
MINDTDLLAYASESDLNDENATELISENRATSKVPEFEEYDVGASFDLNTGDADNAFGIITTGFDPLEVTESGSRIAGYITTDHRSQVRLGTYVIVPYENEHLFARIWKLQYQQQFEVDDATEIHSRRMLRSNTTAELDYKFLAYLDPICILYEHVPGDESSLMRRMADRIPRPNTPILPVTEKLKIQTGLNIPREGIFLGHLSVGGELVRTHASPPTVPYYLRNDYSMGDPLIFRHMLVCGSTGTGKTFLTKNILRQFMSEDNRYQVRDNGDGVKKNKNPCLVIMDPQDEYSQLLEDNPDLVSSDEHNMNSESVKFGGVPSTKTFVAKVDGQNYNGRSRAQQAEFTIPFEMVRSNSWLIAAAGLTELQGIALELLLEDYFKRPGKHTYNGFMEHIDDAGVRGTYVDNGKIHEASYDGIVRKVRNQAFKRVFDQPATPINEMLADIFKAGQICVFPTEYISNTRIRDLITLTLMTIVVDNKLNTSGDALVKETPIILVLDEAHRYLSKGAGEHSKRIISKFADAARQGRKEGLGLFLITQDPQDIDETVFKQVNSRVILNLSNDAAISAMKVKKEYEKRIPYLKKGQMIIQSPDNSDVVEVIGLSKCVVKHV